MSRAHGSGPRAALQARRQRLVGIGQLLDCAVPGRLPVRLRQASEQNQIERIDLTVGAPAEVVSKREDRLASGNRRAASYHHPLVRRAAVHHLKQPVGLADVT